MSARVEYRRGVSPSAFHDLPSGSVHAIITDPPYGLGKGYGRRTHVKGSGNLAEQWRIANDDDLSALEQCVPEMHRVLYRFGVVLVFSAPTERAAVERVLSDGGFRVDGFAPWDKGMPGISYKVRYAYEECVIASHFGTDDPWESRAPICVPFRVPRVQNPEHPNEKPVALLRRYIRWACPNEDQRLVLDPFAGIASCGVAAIAEDKDYIGVECDERWWPIADRRLAGARFRPHPDLDQGTLTLEGA